MLSQLRENWISWRNATLSSSRFQRFAANFPFVRPIAARRAKALFDVVAGFVYSQILYACVRLDLLEKLRVRPRSVQELADDCNMPLHSMQALLRGAASLNLSEELADGRFALGSDGAALLGNPGIAELVLHHEALYSDLADPVALLRRGGGGGLLAGYWPYDANDAESAARYSALMAASQPMLAEQIIRAYDFGRHQSLTDIGGGEGAFLEKVGHRWPDLPLSLFDLPAVAARARARLGSRAKVFDGSFIDDPIPVGADIFTLVRVLHDHDDDVVRKLLKKVHDALPRGGTLLVAEPMAEKQGARAMGHGYFGLYLLAMGSGRPRSAQEISSFLKTAGFASSRLIRTPTPITCRVVVARK